MVSGASVPSPKIRHRRNSYRMRKTTLIILTILTACGLSALSFMSPDSSLVLEQKPAEEMTRVDGPWIPSPLLPQKELDFFYDLGPRYNRTFTKTEMAAARTFDQFDNLDAQNPKHIVSFSSVNVMRIDDSYEPVEEVAGDKNEFNSAQLKLLQSLPYSADVLIRAEYVLKNNTTGELEESYTTPHITVVPETQAEYPGGFKAFIGYVKSHKVDETETLSKEELKPGKIRFTVSKVGTITKIKLISSSGYKKIDKRMVELITEAPGTWKVAQDAEGNRVEQQFVFSYGITGC